MQVKVVRTLLKKLEGSLRKKLLCCCWNGVKVTKLLVLKIGRMGLGGCFRRGEVSILKGGWEHEGLVSMVISASVCPLIYCAWLMVSAAIHYLPGALI